MKSYLKIIVAVSCFVAPFSSFAIFSDIVFDPSVFQETVRNGATATEALNQATETAANTQTSVDQGKINLQKLGLNNWESAGKTIDAANEAADVAGTMTFATSGSVDAFSDLFPGDTSDITGTFDNSSRRLTQSLSTMKANFTAVKKLGDAMKRYGHTLDRLSAARDSVTGQLSAQEQANQIQGNMNDTLTEMHLAQMAHNNAQMIEAANKYQEQKDQLDVQKKLIAKFHGEADYQDKGQRLIPTGWY